MTTACEKVDQLIANGRRVKPRANGKPDDSAPGVATATVATSATEWPEPQPLDRAAALAEPYPLDALPGVIGAAVREYQAYGQQPLGLVASSALAVVSARGWNRLENVRSCFAIR